MLYTGQIRYPGKDRLDITIKSGSGIGKIFAPTWEMVMGVKNGTMSNEEYTAKYYWLLADRWNTHSKEILEFVETVKTFPVTIVCYCKKGDFCHRHLLVAWLVHNFEVQYGGER